MATSPLANGPDWSHWCPNRHLQPQGLSCQHPSRGSWPLTPITSKSLQTSGLNLKVKCKTGQWWGQRMQEEMRSSKPPQGHPSQLPTRPPPGPHLCDGTLGHEQQWEEKNWRKGGKGRGRCGRGKGIKTSKTEEQEAGGFPRTGPQAGPDVENNGPGGWGAGREGGGRPHRRVREVIVLQEPRTRAPLRVHVGRDRPRASARARGSHKVGQAGRSRHPPLITTSLPMTPCSPCTFHFIPTISC